MYDLISIGTISMDLYFKGDSLHMKNEHFMLACGGKYFVDFFHEGLGGGATNVAIAAKKTGLRVGLMAKLGNNTFRKLITEKLAAAGITCALCDIEEDYHNISAILLDKNGEKTVVNYRTPHQKFIEDGDTFASKLKAKGVYVANLPNVSLTERSKILKIAKQNGAVTFLNLGVVDCRRPLHKLESLLKYANILIVNRFEFADLIKREPAKLNLENVSLYQKMPFLSAKTLVVTDGAEGSYCYSNGQIYFQDAVKPKKIIDTTGAGDGYTGAFIAQYIKTKNIQEAMNAGAAYSSHKLSHLGAN